MKKIGLMGAMSEEVELLKSLMHIVSEKKIANRTYYSGFIRPVSVVLVFSRWGKVASASTASTLISHFNVGYIIFTGVAGGVDTSLEIGDVLIGSALYQHDMDASPIFPKYQIPLTENTYFKVK